MALNVVKHLYDVMLCITFDIKLVYAIVYATAEQLHVL